MPPCCLAFHEDRLFLSVLKAQSELSLNVRGREQREGEKEGRGKGKREGEGGKKAPLEPLLHVEKSCPLPSGVYLSSWQNLGSFA